VAVTAPSATCGNGSGACSGWSRGMGRGIARPAW
jgi:hypothetical protein